MPNKLKVTIDGTTFEACRGELLLDAALNNGVDVPFDCRSGHCGTCCLKVLSGSIDGGHATVPGIVHACQCRLVDNLVVERQCSAGVRSVDGILTTLRALSPDVVELGIKTRQALPYRPGQYAQVRFHGYPSRPFSITHPVRDYNNSDAVWFHIRRMTAGVVTGALGKFIMPGHRVTLSGPFGAAYFRPQIDARLVLVATSTGFAPIWSIAAAALRANPERRMMVIAGGRKLQSLYMGPALSQLARFPNVLVVAVCSSATAITNGIIPGRPTDVIPRLLPSDVLYACGAPQMVGAIKAIATQNGATCFADPFVTAHQDTDRERMFGRSGRWRLRQPTAKFGAAPT